MSLRGRLSLLFVVLLGPALASISAVSYMVVSDHLHRGVDRALFAHLASVQSILGAVDDVDRTADGTALLGPEADVFALKVLDRNGGQLYASSPDAERLPPPGEFEVRSGSPVDWEGPAGKQRIVYEPVLGSSGDLLGYVVAGASLEPTHETLAELRERLALGSLALVAAAGLGCYLLCGPGLRPVRAVAAMASEIERSGDFKRRLPHRARGGELGELTRNFNAMLDGAERAIASQRGFMAYSSHELRRPLTVIRTYVDVLDRRDVPEVDRMSSLQEIRLEVDSISRLVSDLLLVSRDDQRPLELKEVDLMPLCSRLFERWREWDSLHHHGFSGEGDAIVLGEAAHLERMINNLLENASQNTEAGGLLGLRVEREGDRVKVSVSDPGSGIPREEQPHIFERSFRGATARKTRREGAGLGLFIVQFIAESHGGQVGFLSEEGKGSIFVVDLPLAG